MLNFKFPNYKLFEYEKLLAKKELSLIFPSDLILDSDIGYHVQKNGLSNDEKEKIRRLTFLRLIKIGRASCRERV